MSKLNAVKGSTVGGLVKEIGWAKLFTMGVCTYGVLSLEVALVSRVDCCRHAKLCGPHCVTVVLISACRSAAAYRHGWHADRPPVGHM